MSDDPEAPAPALVPSEPMPPADPPFFELWTTNTPAPSFRGKMEDGSDFVAGAGIYYHALTRAEYESHIANGWATAESPPLL